MNNYFKTVAITVLISVAAIVSFILISNAVYLNTTDVSRDNIILLNHLVKTAEENKEDLKSLDDTNVDADFVILDLTDNILFSHIKNEDAEEDITLSEAIAKRYPYAYLTDEGSVWGTVILMDDPALGIKRLIRNTALAGLVFILLFLTGMLVFGFYVRKNILVPFRNMKSFAAKVAQGKLDEPLVMDKDNMFGAFSESFDIMREELADAKERELNLQKKERELVASLSHDLKTPVTGIKVTAELMKMRLSVESEQGLSKEVISSLDEDAEGIYKKAEQIDELLADLFTSTLDDLGEFKVSCRDEESKVLADIVKNVDNRAKAVIEPLPEVIINIDKKRMLQVVGNIISNSYKYADTKIDIHFNISGRYLEMMIKDYGPGVSSEEIDLITNKFYRGKDWQDSDKDGHGLGLYISKMLMNKMNGDLIAESDGKGLEITLVIPLS